MVRIPIERSAKAPDAGDCGQIRGQDHQSGPKIPNR